MKEFMTPELTVKKAMLKDILTASSEEDPTTPTKKPDIEMPEIGFDD